MKYQFHNSIMVALFLVFAAMLTASAGQTDNSDSDDFDSTIYPSAIELCDGLINDCTTTVLPDDEIDDDNDGYVE